jgi:hypothetical protein
MAYRVTTEPANRARSAVVQRRPDRFSRNVTIASVTLGCVCLAAAGIAVLGRDHSLGSLPNYVASHKSLKIAWVEPEQQAQFERNPNIASAPAAKATKTASRFDAAFDQLTTPAPTVTAWIGPVPLPHARPRKIVVAAIPLPRERVVTEEIAEPPLPAPPSDKPDLTPLRPAHAPRLMAYAPTRDVIFDSDVTGSIGDAARDLIPPAAARPKLAHTVVRPPVRSKPHHKPTAQEKLWGPVQVASLAPFVPGRDDNGVPRAPYDRQTAVYVISDKKVYMPDGSVLEAHSGYGDKIDDPRFVRVRMRGATPPHVYDLKMRESLFHGVEAIRMLPIGGEDAIFGRDGILAHTYMLGPTGQSNGCVSFKDYDEFLDAFKAGKINRLAVIARLD